MIGAVLGGASESQQSLIQLIGTSTGIAYQLRDDLIGVFGNESDTGKSSDGDIREGKRTLLIDEFYKLADKHDKQQFESIFKNPAASKEDIATIRTLLHTSGAKRSVEECIEKYRIETIHNLDKLAIDRPHREMLAKLITSSLERDR
jgi:geranylgeranyl diphosphate synthase type I